MKLHCSHRHILGGLHILYLMHDAVGLKVIKELV